MTFATRPASCSETASQEEQYHEDRNRHTLLAVLETLDLPTQLAAVISPATGDDPGYRVFHRERRGHSRGRAVLLQNGQGVECNDSGWNLPREQLLRRAVGRNFAALATDADWVWFADCDYAFGENALDALNDVPQSGVDLVFPRIVLSSRSEQAGDEIIRRARGDVRIMSFDPRNFVTVAFDRAIGGVQTARGEVVRKHGYCQLDHRSQKPAGRWMRTFEDVQFRQDLGTDGTSIDMPNVFRILHTRRGRTEPNACL